MTKKEEFEKELSRRKYRYFFVVKGQNQIAFGDKAMSDEEIMANGFMVYTNGEEFDFDFALNALLNSELANLVTNKNPL